MQNAELRIKKEVGVSLVGATASVARNPNQIVGDDAFIVPYTNKKTQKNTKNKKTSKNVFTKLTNCAKIDITQRNKKSRCHSELAKNLKRLFAQNTKNGETVNETKHYTYRGGGTI
ncbi:MAG: hypothetical protein LBT20_01635 [Clostridiales bacterium]|jgi:hypothetical protein|nr:hypothetical protein [Clostridiales bacterium]